MPVGEEREDPGRKSQEPKGEFSVGKKSFSEKGNKCKEGSKGTKLTACPPHSASVWAVSGGQRKTRCLLPWLMNEAQNLLGSCDA